MSSDEEITVGDVAEEYDFSSHEEYSEQDGKDQAFSSDEEQQPEELSMPAFDFTGMEDEGEPSTFDFHIHSGKP